MSLTEILRKRKLIIPMLMVFIALLVQTSWTEEDAFITLRTSYNLIHGYGLRWNVDERVQTFTNPLWMFMLSGVHAIIKNPYLTLILLSIVVSVATLFVLLVYIPNNNFGILLAFSILVLSKAFVDFSTSGLENPGSHLLAIAFVALYFKAEKPISERNLFGLSLLAGLAAFNRMDTLLFYLPVLLSVLFSQRSKRNLLIMLAGFSPFLLWEIFAVSYYGFPVPNTYYAKLNTGVPMGASLTQGFLYFVNSLGWDPITLTMIFSALILTFLSKRREDILIAAGVILYLGYILYIGGDYMSGRFFSTPLILSAVLIVRRVEDASTLERYTWIGLVLLLGLALAPLKSYSTPLENETVTFDNTTGIADEKLGYYLYTNMLLFSRQDSKLHPFAEYGLKLRNEHAKYAVVTGIGMTGYYAGPGVHIIDELGLGDPLLSHLKPQNVKDWRIAHFKRTLPDGYQATIESGQNEIVDPNLAAYYDKMHLITSGNIWSTARWEAIWRMGTGQYNYLIDTYMQDQQNKTAP